MSHLPRVALAVLLAGCALATPLRAQQPAPAPAATPAAPVVNTHAQKLVLCWYMMCYGNSVERYKEEIALAQRHGIDGFVLDMGAWSGSYLTSAERMYEAAKQLNSGFWLCFAPEYSAGPYDKNFSEMVLLYKDHPNQLKHDGKVVLSGYGGPDMYQGALKICQDKGVGVFLLPSVFMPRFAYNLSPEAYEDLLVKYPEIDGFMQFDGSSRVNILYDNAATRRATMRRHKLLAACVLPTYNSANLQDMHGLSGYLDMWQGALNDGADWISIVIWNDYNEDSGLMPCRWPPGQNRELFDRDESYLLATAYSSALFKTGRAPAITQDQFVVTYRNRSKWLRQLWDGKQWLDLSLAPNINYDQIHDDVEDIVNIDAFLTAPATLTVQLGGKVQKLELPAGVGHAEVPLVPGVPQLTLERGGKVLADVVGRKLIIEKATEANSRNTSQHTLNRTWTSGTAIGPVRRLEAAAGTLQGGATLVEEGDRKLVQTLAADESGFTLPVDGLQTATYNVRIVYRNPAPEEARLTLRADGPPRAKGEFPYFIPAFLPPTPGNETRTVSFLWSLYDTTTTLKLHWLLGRGWDGKHDPVQDDVGTVQVQAIELVQVAPVVLPAVKESVVPELVLLPAGTFAMGSTAGEPDEAPVHQVQISSFAMAKYEVTNADFERFDASHRAFRNGNSWRDREPVLAVSWTEAAKYCNWLSEQTGLTPVYAEQALDPAKPKEKVWMANLAANGFRLPTEAEWEYAASGRGEGRLYPWGKDAPQPNVNGRFQLKAALANRLPRPATEDNGVVVVGSYPAGASRDGIMDLAGNAAEWCSDWYAPYPADAQTDPCHQQPGNFRVIRGGSWSWYNYSQRVTDREFNSQNYPGHAYYGFRVVLPEAGYKKLNP